MKEYKVYDMTEDNYTKDIGNDFESIKISLSTHWIDEDDSEYGDMYDRIMGATSLEELNEYAEGLGYLIMERDDM